MPQLPTVGRIMYLYDLAKKDVDENGYVLPPPSPIIISFVSEDGTRVSGTSFSVYGSICHLWCRPGSGCPRQDIRVVQPEEDIPFHLDCLIAMWMPDQVATHAAAEEIKSAN